ncbi:MAG: ArnT family glycosyltransferase [Chloroflexota bacterium]
MQAAVGSTRPRGAQRAIRFSPVTLLTTLALAAIFLVGLHARWDRLAFAEFNADQAWVINRAYDFVTRGDFPLAGILSSVGTAQGPVETYLIAIPTLFSSDPAVVSGFVGFWQMLAVLGTYFFTSRYFGRTAGLVAAALFAANPWALQHARKIWTPNMMPPFTLLFFAALFGLAVEKRRYQFGLACLWLVVLFLIHPEATVFVPLLGLAFLLYWRRLGWQPVLLGLGLGLLAALPFLIYEAGRGFTSFRIYLGFGGAPQAHVDLEPLYLITMMGSALGYPERLEYSFRGAWSLPDLTLQNWLGTGLLVLGWGLCLYRAVTLYRQRAQSPGWEKWALLFLWCLLPVPVSARHYIDMQPHYFVTIYPGQFVVLGVTLAWLGGLATGLARRRLAARAAWLSGALVVGVVLWLGLSQLGLYRAFLDNTERIGPQRPYGMPLVYFQEVVANLRELRAQLGPAPTYVYAYNYRIPLDYLARPDLRLEHVDPPLRVVLPRELAQGAVFLLASDDSAIAAKDKNFHAVDDDGPIVPQLRALGFEEASEQTVRGPDGYVYFRYFYLPAARGLNLLSTYAPPPAQPALESGQLLAGVALPATVKAGEQLPLSLLWNLPDDPERRSWVDYNFSVHLVDQKGQSRRAQDWELLQYLGWRKGDYLVDSQALAVPADLEPGVYWLDLGAYTRFGRQPVAWQDASGQQRGTTARLGPLRVLPAREPAAPAVATGQTFGAALQLEGYTLPQEARAGAALSVSLHWRAALAPGADYVVSTQLVGPDGRLVAQHDSPPAAGNFPTGYWQAGERVLDRHELALPRDLAAGEYRLHVVVYSAQNQARLPVAGADSLSLATIKVSP